MLRLATLGFVAVLLIFGVASAPSAFAEFVNATTLVDDSVSFLAFVDDTANEPAGPIALGSGVNWSVIFEKRDNNVAGEFNDIKIITKHLVDPHVGEGSAQSIIGFLPDIVPGGTDPGFGLQTVIHPTLGHKDYFELRYDALNPSTSRISIQRHHRADNDPPACDS